MDRKRGIIFAITGIFIISIALLGLTYGYFATKVQGNTKDKSVYLSTMNLRLVYDDGTDDVLSKEKIVPGTEIGSKTFSVRSESDNEIDEYQVYFEDVINEFVNVNDIVVNITCSSTLSNGTTGTCNGYDGIFPLTNQKIISNSIKPGERHEYVMTIEYVETGEDQSDDMGKILSGKLQIYNPDDVIDIRGKVTNYDSKYFVEIVDKDNNTKTSRILSDNTYIIPGLIPGNYIMNIKYIDDSGVEQTVASKNISIMLGEEENITSDASEIIMTTTSEYFTVNINLLNYDSIIFEGKVSSGIPFEEGTLAYEIYQNKAQVQTYTKDGDTYTVSYIELNKNVNELTTVTGIADGTNIEDNGLFYAEDDYGTSYIYRGSVINNYVDFAGFTWRIVRINGDGSVRLILDGTLDKVQQKLSDGTLASNYAGSTSAFNSSFDDNAYVGYTYGQVGVTDGSGDKTAYDLTHEYTGDKTNTNDKTGQSAIKQAVDTFYKTYLLDDYHDYISDTLFCGDKSLAQNGIGGVTTQLGYGTDATYYAATERLYYSSGITSIIEATPTLKCVPNNTSLTEDQKAYSRYTVSGNSINGIKTNDDLIYPIALLSADELVMSGAFKSAKNLQYYLYNSSTLSSYWWTVSPSYFVGSFASEFVSFVSIVSDDSLYVSHLYYTYGVRPVINLSYENVLYEDGDGTSADPYIVSLKTS